MRLVVGLDPGTGKTSPTGFAAFDPETRALIHTERITSEAEEYRDRYREIAGRIGELLEVIDPDMDVLVVCESFVLRGKGGEILARLTGAFMAAVPARQRFAFVQNTTVKKIVGGHGRADKHEVALGVFAWLSGNDETSEQVRHLINNAEWDVLDAIAIGIAGYLRDVGE